MSSTIGKLIRIGVAHHEEERPDNQPDTVSDISRLQGELEASQATLWPSRRLMEVLRSPFVPSFLRLVGLEMFSTSSSNNF